MCLEINKKLHRCLFAKSGYKAIRLKEDMPVYKILIYSAYQNMWSTPFQGLQVRFAGGRSVLESFTDKQFRVVVGGCYKAEFGYHSYVSKEFAELALAKMDVYRSSYLYHGKPVLCNATIPKGSMVFYGDDGDICSSNLVIKDPNDTVGLNID